MEVVNTHPLQSHVSVQTLGTIGNVWSPTMLFADTVEPDPIGSVMYEHLVSDHSSLYPNLSSVAEFQRGVDSLVLELEIAMPPENTSKRWKLACCLPFSGL